MNPEGESTVLEQSKSVNSGFLERQLRDPSAPGRVVVMVTAAAWEVRKVPLHLSREGGQVGQCHRERETEITFQYRYNSPFFNG